VRTRTGRRAGARAPEKRFLINDAAALAERIDRLGREKNLGRTLGRQARRFIAEKCAVPEYARRLFDVYAEAGRKVGNARGPA
jgi:hypothetical protein